MSENKHYRYCFNCNKWKTKSEINEVDLGGNNKTFNCNVCRKDLGDTIQIFRCKKHDDEILKVWGTCEGKNQEKIFFDKCPHENKEEKPVKSPNEPSTLNMVLIIISVLSIIGIGITLFIRNRRKKI